MFLGSICCRPLENIAVVEYVLKLGCEEGAELVSSDISIEGEIDENLEVKVYGTDDGIRQGPEGEVLGNTH